jgi:serine/alanine adding enzyme
VGWAERLDKVSMVLPLPSSEEALAQRLGSKLRSQIRRSEREQLELTWGGAELIADFYRVFAAAMHALGTPVYSRRFFEVVQQTLGNSASVLIVRMRGRVHAAAIIVRHARSVEVPWAVASPEAKRLSVNVRMYWELLRRAIALGAEAFDFGRSTVNSGTYRFKAQWGAQPRQLHWHYWLPAGASVPMLNQTNPKYAQAAALWRCMPPWCANLLGPYLARNLP